MLLGMRKPLLPGLFALAACGSSGGGGSPPDAPRRSDAMVVADAGRTDAAPDAGVSLRPALPCADPMDAVYAAPAQGAEPLGAILACAHDRAISAALLADAALRLRYSGRASSSGTDVYRIAYRTDRGPGGRGVGTALVMVPDHPRTSGPQPLVVAAHGVVGQARRCAPSRGDLAAVGDFRDDARGLDVPLAADGWLVVAPDYGGYSTDWPPGFLIADDEGRGVLDATRAAAQLFPASALSGKVALVGHSQGGHAVLSAQSLARTHGHYGELAAVVAFTPLWISAANFAALASDISGVTTAGAPYLFGYGLQYFWTHAERYEGRMAAEAMFLPRALAGVRSYIEDGCLLDEETRIPMLGTMASDLYDPAFGDDVAGCAISPDSCGSAVAMRWQSRFLADRPHLDAKGAPVMLLFGGADTTITPPRAQCAIDRVTADLAAPGATATLTVCGDPLATHSGVATGEKTPFAATRRMMRPALEWLDARLLGAPPPAPCSARIVPAGMPEPPCTTPPSND